MSNWKIFALIAVGMTLVSCASTIKSKQSRTPSTEQNKTYELRQRAQLERELGSILGKTAFISDYQMKLDETI